MPLKLSYFNSCCADCVKNNARKNISVHTFMRFCSLLIWKRVLASYLAKYPPSPS